MIATWLAGKVSGIIIFLIACLSIVLIPAVIVQTVRLNGISVFGWYAVDGYKPMYEKLLFKDNILLGNVSALQGGLDRCNVSVTGLAAAGKTMTAAAQALVDARLKEQEAFGKAISKVGAIKPTDAKCPSVDNIFNTGFAQ